MKPAIYVIVILIIVAVLGGAGYYLYQRQQTKISAVPTPNVPATSSQNTPAPTLPSAIIPVASEATSSDQTYQNPFDTTINPFTNLQ